MSTVLESFRESNPAYKDREDGPLAFGLWNASYKDRVSMEDFAKQIGISGESLKAMQALAKEKGVSTEAQPGPAFATTGDTGLEHPQPEGTLGEQLRDPFTGELRKRGFEEIEEFSPQAATSDPDVARKIQLGFLVAQDPQQKMDIVKHNIPEAKFHQMQNGAIMVRVGNQRWWLDEPGVTLRGTVEGTIGALPETIAAVTTPGLPLVRALGTAGKALVTGGTEAGISIGKDIGAQQFGSKQDPNLTRAALLGTVGALGTALPGAIALGSEVRAGRGLMVPASEAELAQRGLKETAGITEATGIPLFPAQKTVSPSGLALQEKLLTTQRGVAGAVDALKQQNKAAGDAVENLLNDLAPATVTPQAPARVRAAAEESIDVAKMRRAEETSPLYNSALDGPDALGDVTLTQALIQGERRKYAKGTKTYGHLTKLMKLLRVKQKQMTETKVLPDGTIKFAEEEIVETGITNPRHLHSVKLEMDAMLAQFGESALDNTSRRVVEKVRKQLLEEMDAHIPGYAQARTKYAEGSETVQALVDSPVRAIADIKPENMERVANIVFNATPEVARQVRGVLNKTDPDAWDALIRFEIERRINKASRPVATGAGVVNEPAFLAGALTGGRGRKNDVLRGAMSPQQREVYDWLVKGLEAAAKGKPRGEAKVSPAQADVTVWNSPFKFYGRVTGGIAGIPRVSVDPGRIDVISNARISAFTKAMFDPAWEPLVRQIIKFSPGSQRSSRAISVLMTKIMSEDTKVETRDQQ